MAMAMVIAVLLQGPGLDKWSFDEYLVECYVVCY